MTRLWKRLTSLALSCNRRNESSPCFDKRDRREKQGPISLNNTSIAETLSGVNKYQGPLGVKPPHRMAENL